MLSHVNNRGINALIHETFNMCKYLSRIDGARIN
jgi:hypothetical protein